MPDIAPLYQDRSMYKPIAPAWHSAVVLLCLIALSALGVHQRGLPKTRLPRLSARLSSYVAVMAFEWAIVAFICAGVRLRVISRRDLISEHCPTRASALRDLGLAIGFLAAANAVLAVIGFLLRAESTEAVEAMLPQTAIETLGFVLLSCTSGFCEELIFRGYLQRQFEGYTESSTAGLVLQGITFGVSHGYQGPKFMIIISVFGCLFGWLACWRQSLRPGMLAHGLQNASSGVMYWISGSN